MSRRMGLDTKEKQARLALGVISRAQLDNSCRKDRSNRISEVIRSLLNWHSCFVAHWQVGRRTKAFGPMDGLHFFPDIAKEITILVVNGNRTAAEFGNETPMTPDQGGNSENLTARPL